MGSEVDNFEAASRKLKGLANVGMGLLGPRRAAEARYSETYQAMVKAGQAPQIRAKYRQ